MNKINELEFKSFVELVSYLNKENTNDNFYVVSKRLQKFMPDLNGAETLLLENLVSAILKDEEDAEEMFTNFKSQAGDKLFNEKGDSEVARDPHEDLELMTCEMVYENAEKALKESNFEDKTPNRVNLQIYYAKTLEPLIKNKGVYEYPLRKALYFKKDPNRPIRKEDFTVLEGQISKIFNGEKNNILGSFLNYIFPKKREHVYYFIQHFRTRVSSLARSMDLSVEANRIFYEALQKLV